ncbi:branched-chain amino acid ABC transporter ATP-binding protein/permease [Vineibacter terrae]|uniref:branched-chain amino acid ABC transporter ATP-binding protein/permease n=1 Tax=Vineibacter terrae TaxID=2586908 RepID=UPI002E31E5A4|nr:branched-chain amino acid ABC transporter ATP-binding protein/permease [Vineibacter terrae]HEX2885144.1 branched-chain amino acid ABC transporter ATP-binding protein/permease [Vineibacter terrae]
MARRRPPYRELAAITGIVGAFVVVLLLVDSAYYRLILTLVVIWATLGLAWNMLSGYGGLISFGHAAFFGLGAYTVTLAMVKLDITPWLGIPMGVVVGMVAGLLVGLPTFRLRGHYFGLAMLAYPLAMLYVFEWLGYQEVTLPMKREQPAAWMQFSDPRVHALLGLGLMVLALLASLAVERSRFGRALRAIKQNEAAAEAAGIDTWRWKMPAMVLSAGFAAAAGGLYAVVLLIVTPPTVFGVLVSAQALIVCLFGGVGTLWGPVIGAAILVPLAEILHGELGSVVPGIQGVVYGLAIIAIILLAPEGIFWRLRDRFFARAPEVPTQAPAPDPPVALARPHHELLVLEGVSRSFGGLRAIDNVSLAVEEGTVHGIIGPNGAGKTTLFNVINGFLQPASGTIRFDGRDIVGLRPNRICRAGIGRTFQIVRAFPRMTVLENVTTGAYVATPDDREAERLALWAIDRVGLSRREAGQMAAGLTMRQLRLLELARAVAARPRLLLLDEILAGLGHAELEEVVEAIRRIARGGTTVLIIEHTMHAMVRLADRLTVLDHGALIADGPPAAVTRDAAVIEAYLGKKWVQRAADRVA